MRLWFIGTHGTGKTTQVNHFANLHKEFHIMKSERRKLVEDGIIKVNREAAPWDEIVIGGDVMKSILSTPSPSVADRSWVDKCAYAQLLPYDEDILDAIHVYYANAFPGYTDEDIYVYFPPILELKADGVRDMDKKYQMQVDEWIQFYLNYLMIPYYELYAESVQDRYLQILEFIKERGLSLNATV